MEAAVRVTGGEAKGRPIRGPRGSGIRPTSDRVREALFDILGARARDATFLDAFAGTGAIGVEALSRGARRVVFLEKDGDALRLIRENLKLHAWKGAAELMPGEVRRSLRLLATRGEPFSVVFLDPPYGDADSASLLTLAARVVSPDGIVVLEHRSGARVDVPPGVGLRWLRQYRHGDTTLTSLLPAPSCG